MSKIYCNGCGEHTEDDLEYFDNPDNGMHLCKDCFLKEDITILFKKEVHDISDRVDPEGEEHWRSLTIGYALGKGKSPEFAQEFALYMRYHTDLG